MFTGIVEEMGAVTVVERTLAGTRVTLLASTIMSDLKIGDSVSVNFNTSDYSRVYSVSHTNPYATVDGVARTVSHIVLRPVRRFKGYPSGLLAPERRET